jgi:hypothetical protein
MLFNNTQTQGAVKHGQAAQLDLADAVTEQAIA